MDASVIPRAFAFIRHRSTASATTASTSTGCGSGMGSAAWILDSVMRSWTRNVRLGVLGGVLDRLGEQGERAHRGLQFVADVGHEVPADLLHPSAFCLVFGE